MCAVSTRPVQSKELEGRFVSLLGLVLLLIQIREVTALCTSLVRRRLLYTAGRGRAFFLILVCLPCVVPAVPGFMNRLVVLSYAREHAIAWLPFGSGAFPKTADRVSYALDGNPC